MTYVFRCKKCAPRKEVEFEMGVNDPVPTCARCKMEMSKVMQGFAVDLSGPGFTGAGKNAHRNRK